MALNDPTKKKPVDPALAALQDSYAPVRQGYDAANAQVQGLTAKRDALQGIVKPDLVIPRNDFAPVTQVSDTPGGVTALQAVTAQLGQATQARDAYIPKLNQAAQGFRDYTDRTNANTLLRQAGVAPLPLPATPSAAAAPVRNPAGPGPAAGAPAPAGGVAASVPPARAGAAIPAAKPDFANTQGTPLKAGDANTFTFSNGKTVPVPGMTAQATTAAMNGQANPAATGAPLPLPSAYAAPPAPTPDMTVNVPRPVVADPYNTRQADDGMKKVADAIDIALFRNSFAADRGSRSARDAQASMLQTLAGLQGKRLDTAAGVASGDRDTSAKVDLTGMEQGAANQRALLQDQGETTRQGMGDASKERQQYLQSLAEMGKATTTLTDTNGNLLRFNPLAGNASQVLDANGNPVRPAQVKQEDSNLDSITKELDSLYANPPIQSGANDPTYAAWQARVAALQQRADAARVGSAAKQQAPAVGTERNGYRFKGGNPADQASWEKVN